MGDSCCKVGRVVEKRALHQESRKESIDEYLLDRWLGKGEYSETGIRPLTDWFNKQLLKEEYAENGRSTATTRLESDYEALRTDDEIIRGEVIDDLETDDIAGEDIATDFISKSTLQRHLTDCLGGEKETDRRSESNWEQDRIEYVRETIAENVEGALRSLENRGELPGATEADMEVPVVLRCPECTTRVRFKTARERGYICDDHLGSAADETVDSHDDDSSAVPGDSSP